ncbi:MAG: SAM hydrolase/SAM-dependent halogenase family protein [Actinomycetota bacterium]
MGTAAQEVAPLRLVTFSSDYGPTDEYVGVCHLVITRIAPDCRVVDLAHGIKGIRAGATILAQSVVHAPEGSVHLAVVDPGVGTDRRGLAIVCRRGDVLVGPDNGLLPPAADVLGGAADVYELTEPRYRLEPVSSTFHGRDVFAPAAAHLATGVRAAELGDGVDVDALVRLPGSLVGVSPGRLESDVTRTDWYGNLQLAATGDDLARACLGPVATVGCEAGEFTARVGRTFADAEPGELVVYVDSGDHVAIASNGGSARERLQDPERVVVTAKT